MWVLQKETECHAPISSTGIGFISSHTLVRFSVGALTNRHLLLEAAMSNPPPPVQGSRSTQERNQRPLGATERDGGSQEVGEEPRSELLPVLRTMDNFLHDSLNSLLTSGTGARPEDHGSMNLSEILQSALDASVEIDTSEEFMEDDEEERHDHDSHIPRYPQGDNAGQQNRSLQRPQ